MTSESIHSIVNECGEQPPPSQENRVSSLIGLFDRFVVSLVHERRVDFAASIVGIDCRYDGVESEGADQS